MIVIVGESGCGKTTLLNNIVKKYPEFKKIVTYTTRPMREGEQDGVDYYFLSEEDFSKLVAQDFFVEHAEYRGWHYGTALKDCQPNSIVVLTPSGMRSLKRLKVEMLSIYLSVDRASRLINLIHRGDNIDEAYRRNLSDVGMFDAIEKEVDFTIKNEDFHMNKMTVLSEFENILKREGFINNNK